MDNEKIIVTLSGCDRIGIVAELTAALAKYSVNIEDIKQTIMQDYFVMFLLGDISKSEYSFKDIKQGLLDVGEKLGMELWVQKKQIFDNMHTI
ncbi:MAG: ACT domain-containing protein [Candidatus Gastranaerophilales bacterium]|nr:ACT domain-containing protein [Candidatus Gastranaerophilales bacterium]